MATPNAPPPKPNTHIHIEPALPSDLPACMAIRVPSFSAIPIEHILYGPDSATTRAEACTRHLKAWQVHQSRHGPDSVNPIKAVYTDPKTGEEIVIGYAEWYFYPAPETKSESKDGVPVKGMGKREPNPLCDPERVPVDKRQVMHEWLDPVNAAREDFMGDKGYALLMYMCVDPKWRRRGASRMCVQWGMDRCDEMGVPGWLEASEEGRPVYEGLGWEGVCEIECAGMGFPGMIYWPKRPQEEGGS